MSWKDIIKNENFDWDKEMKNIFEKLTNFYVSIGYINMSSRQSQLREDFKSIENSLHELEYWYEKNKEKLQ
jgi:hypothetical protein